MHVVPARVHDAVVLRRELEAGRLGDRQRVDITAQRDHGRLRAAAAHARHQSRARNAADIRNSRVLQHALEFFLRARLVPRELGMAVQIAPQFREQPALVGFESELRFSFAHARSSAVRTVSAATRSTSSSTPIPGRSSGTRTMPRSIVHSGETMSRAQYRALGLTSPGSVKFGSDATATLYARPTPLSSMPPHHTGTPLCWQKS